MSDQCSVKAWLNRILSLDLKTDRELLMRTACGSEFQTDGAGNRKARRGWVWYLREYRGNGYSMKMQLPRVRYYVRLIGHLFAYLNFSGVRFFDLTFLSFDSVITESEYIFIIFKRSAILICYFYLKTESILNSASRVQQCSGNRVGM